MSSLKIVLHSFSLVVACMVHDGQVMVLKIAVEFLVNNVAFGHIFLQLFFSFSPVSNNLPTLQTRISFTTANAI